MPYVPEGPFPSGFFPSLTLRDNLTRFEKSGQGFSFNDLSTRLSTVFQELSHGDREFSTASSTSFPLSAPHDP